MDAQVALGKDAFFNPGSPMAIIKMSSAQHPIWGIARLCINMVGLVVTLWLSAEHFDETELKTLTVMFLLTSSTEGATSFLRQFKISPKAGSSASGNDDCDK